MPESLSRKVHACTFAGPATYTDDMHEMKFQTLQAPGGRPGTTPSPNRHISFLSIVDSSPDFRIRYSRHGEHIVVSLLDTVRYLPGGYWTSDQGRQIRVRPRTTPRFQYCNAAEARSL